MTEIEYSDGFIRRIKANKDIEETSAEYQGFLRALKIFGDSQNLATVTLSFNPLDVSYDYNITLKTGQTIDYLLFKIDGKIDRYSLTTNSTVWIIDDLQRSILFRDRMIDVILLFDMVELEVIYP